jgi:hypothetical protein
MLEPADPKGVLLGRPVLLLAPRVALHPRVVGVAQWCFLLCRSSSSWRRPRFASSASLTFEPIPWDQACLPDRGPCAPPTYGDLGGFSQGSQEGVHLVIKE